MILHICNRLPECSIHKKSIAFARKWLLVITRSCAQPPEVGAYILSSRDRLFRCIKLFSVARHKRCFKRESKPGWLYIYIYYSLVCSTSRGGSIYIVIYRQTVSLYHKLFSVARHKRCFKCESKPGWLYIYIYIWWIKKYVTWYNHWLNSILIYWIFDKWN